MAAGSHALGRKLGYDRPMNRRHLISLLGTAAAASFVSWPRTARAQPAMPVVGYLGVSSSDQDSYQLRSLREGLREAGFIEGQNVAFEYRWAESQNDRLPALAAELVQRQVTVIALGGLPPTLAVKAATTTIPIVFQMGVDPVAAGLVASLARPGGNLTGVSNLNAELGPKRLELLRDVVPAAKVIGLLVNPTNPGAANIVRDVGAAAGTLGIELHVLHASVDRDLDAVFASLAQLRAGGLLIGTDGFLIRRATQLGALSLRHAVPAIFQTPEFVAAGGLMSYGANLRDAYRQVGLYTARILKGEKPADLPVQQSTKADLILNLKVAKALGIAVPLPMLGRADEVIE
jgi:putative ABC transport system substrate-binding protein